jgi:hypothetical protein
MIHELDTEMIEFLFKNKREDLISMVRKSCLPLDVMRLVFDVVRPEGGLVIHIARLSMSHPDAEVRAMATVELCAFTPVAALGRFLWC